MWEKSEKHLALLFCIAAAPVTGFTGVLLTLCSAVHLGYSIYYTFKE
ncbi:hypothetical protein PHB09_094 [Pseudomonas phage PHB09]|uniref:Uncharacterized protein n=1 Tax=Pseudomonas phage PHB09 TaxID=2867265 RepID=A0AAE8XCC8_9CAUD|nr:hypothetical protein QGX10_gp094 [Pseudomonas phage PHB09]UAV84590.1 hypothetical protein PHB09_094 [Pseudomonas phage PHB09]